MKSIVVPALLAVAFAVAGFVFWTLGKTEARLAEAHRQLAMLHYADAAADSDATMAEAPLVQRVGGFGKDDQTDAKHLRATADYWQEQYAALEPKRDTSGSLTETDPDALLNGANASFRASQSDADRNATLRRLDAVVKSYGDALKSNGSNAGATDVAYNYEYAIRLRDALAKMRPGQAAKAAARAAGESEPPAGPTLHGRPGGPPAKTDMAQFKIVIPKRGEERKDDPQAGKGNVKIRKG